MVVAAKYESSFDGKEHAVPAGSTVYVSGSGSAAVGSIDKAHSSKEEHVIELGQGSEGCRLDDR